MENIKLYLTILKSRNERELGRLYENDDDCNYYYKVGFCKGQLDMIKLVEQLIEEKEHVEHKWNWIKSKDR